MEKLKSVDDGKLVREHLSVRIVQCGDNRTADHKKPHELGNVVQAVVSLFRDGVRVKPRSVGASAGHKLLRRHDHSKTEHGAHHGIDSVGHHGLNQSVGRHLGVCRFFLNRQCVFF